jgi:DNA-binding GntR family transcriptional regulator
MQDWTPDIRTAKGPKYLAIAQAMSRDIEAGVLAAGDRLPRKGHWRKHLGWI